MADYSLPCLVRLTPSSAPELRALVAHLWAELGSIYPEMNSHTPKEIAGPGSGFVVAWLNGEAVGCGAWRSLGAIEAGVAEIKRMFVEPTARRRGISRQILGELERLALADGYAKIRLETGLRQPHAIRLYETSGYSRIEPYGRYRDDPLSVCYEKAL